MWLWTFSSGILRRENFFDERVPHEHELAIELQKMGEYLILFRSGTGYPSCGILFNEKKTRIINIVQIPEMVTNFELVKYEREYVHSNNSFLGFPIHDVRRLFM